MERAGELRVAPSEASNGVQWLQVPGWEGIPWLWHGFSTRRSGKSTVYGADGQSELNLGFTADDPRGAVEANRRLLAEALTGEAETPLRTIRQVHSNFIVVADRDFADRPKPPKADGVITDQPGLLLGVLTADCVPVLAADKRKRVVGTFHAGWRGTAKRIVEAGIGRMRMEFGCRPEEMVAAIGPGIGQCCYAVGEEVLAQFESQFAYGRELFIEREGNGPTRAEFPATFLNRRAPGHGPTPTSLHLDLAEANRRQLMAAGLKAESIQVVGGCTSCLREWFFSHRASGGRTGRMMSGIGIRPR